MNTKQSQICGRGLFSYDRNELRIHQIRNQMTPTHSSYSGAIRVKSAKKQYIIFASKWVPNIGNYSGGFSGKVQFRFTESHRLFLTIYLIVYLIHFLRAKSKESEEMSK